jgi:hypothetical protein
MTLLIIKFRPSSHSVDGTIISTFKRREDAVAAAEKFRRSTKIGCRTFGSSAAAYFHSEEDGCLQDAQKIMKSLGAKTSIYAEEFIQKLVITIKLPREITKNQMPLVIGQNLATLIAILRSLCHCKKRETRKYLFLEFRYEGEAIFFVDGKKRTFETADAVVQIDSAVKVVGLY